MPVSDDTRRLEPPALPNPPSEYNQRAFGEFNNVLRLFFNRLSNVLRIIMNTTEFGIFGSGSAADAFGRFRVSDPHTLFDSKQLYDDQPLYWDDSEVSGSGTTSTHSAAMARTQLAVGATTAGRRVRQTFQSFNYQPGKSQLIYLTGVLGAGESGITTRIGLGDDDNGLFFECDDGTVSVNVRTKTSGSVVNNTVAQTAWNKDTLDGNGLSGLNADWDKALIFLIDYEWLGVGTVRFGVIVDAKVYYVHQVDNSNAIANVYMSTPNLPLRYEIENDGTGGAYTLDHICSTVISEGGNDAFGIQRSASTDGTGVTCSTEDITYAIIGIRLKSGYTHSVVKMIRAEMAIHSASKYGRWDIILNPTVAGTFTYSDQTNSAIQVATGATANTVTNGTVVNTGFIESGQPELGMEHPHNSRWLGRDISGTVDELVLCFTPIGGTSAVDVEGSITWKEL